MATRYRFCYLFERFSHNEFIVMYPRQFNIYPKKICVDLTHCVINVEKYIKLNIILTHLGFIISLDFLNGSYPFELRFKTDNPIRVFFDAPDLKILLEKYLLTYSNSVPSFVYDDIMKFFQYQENINGEKLQVNPLKTSVETF